MTSNSNEQNDDRSCDNCGRWIEPNEMLYHARIELFADKRYGLDCIDKEMEKDSVTLEELIEQLEKMTNDQVQSAADQVYEKVELTLCPTCRLDLHKRMKNQRNVLGEL